jgi:secreted trypsin-like serine protease
MSRVCFIIAVIYLATALAQNNRQGRIVNGQSVGLGQIPYQISLRDWPSGFHFCGGALISSRWVVTAGQLDKFLS